MILNVHKKVPNLDGSITEVPRGRPKLRKEAIPSSLQGPYYSESSAEPARLSFNTKEDVKSDLLYKCGRIINTTIDTESPGESVFANNRIT